MSKRERKEYKKAWYEAHKEQVRARKKAWRESHKEQVKAWNEANKEQERARTKAWYEAHKEQQRAKQKAWNATHKQDQKAYQKAYYQANKEQQRAQMKAWREAHKEQQRANMKAWREAHKERVINYIKCDLNSLGKTKNSIRRESLKILKQMNLKLPDYQIHHCFGYEDANRFIYISKSLHLKIHQYLRDHNISADSNHWMQIRDIVNAADEFTYIRC